MTTDLDAWIDEEVGEWMETLNGVDSEIGEVTMGYSYRDTDNVENGYVLRIGVDTDNEYRLFEDVYRGRFADFLRLYRGVADEITDNYDVDRVESPAW